MLADDIILLSETTEGPQQCINNLQNYCIKWKLQINVKKTKTIIFNKSGAKMKSVHLHLSQTRLDNVTQCTYLGFTISASGTFSYGIRKLIDKAKRAWFAIRRIMVKIKTQKY